MMAKKLNLMIITAHPDDAEAKAGGTAILYRKMNHKVKFLCMTNGMTGHHIMGGGELARRRQKEAQNSASLIGAECTIFDISSNELEPCLYYRKLLIEEIREFKPDIVITHRLYDYHPDHRYTSQLVMDAATSLHIPNVCPLVPELKQTPVIIYAYDNFQKPVPFYPDIVVDVDTVIETKLNMWHCHTSQMYEWLPYETGKLHKVPKSDKERKKWLATWRLNEQIHIANKFRDKLIQIYGKKRGKKVKYAEAFEFSEYGAHIKQEEIKQFFPFL